MGILLECMLWYHCFDFLGLLQDLSLLVDLVKHEVDERWLLDWLSIWHFLSLFLLLLLLPFNNVLQLLRIAFFFLLLRRLCLE